jgi:hypothetical protein
MGMSASAMWVLADMPICDGAPGERARHARCLFRSMRWATVVVFVATTACQGADTASDGTETSHVGDGGGGIHVSVPPPPDRWSGDVPLTGADGGGSEDGPHGGPGCPSQALTLYKEQCYIRHIAAGQAHLYWSVGGLLYSGPKSSGDRSQLYISWGEIADLMVDGDHLYIAYSGAPASLESYTNDPPSADTHGAVVRLPLGGNSITTVASDLDWPAALAADPLNLYVAIHGPPLECQNGNCAEEYRGGVSVVPKNGGPVTRLVEGVTAVTAVAVDADHVYFGTNGYVRKVPINGGPTETLASGAYTVQSIALDASYVYFAEGQGPINRVPIGGGATELLYSSGGLPRGLNVDANHLYWVAYKPSGFSLRIPLNGGTAQILGGCEGFPSDLALDEEQVFWVNWGGINKPDDPCWGNIRTVWK